MPGIKNWHLTIKCTLLSSQGPDTPRTDQTNGLPKSSPTTKTRRFRLTASESTRPAMLPGCVAATKEYITPIHTPAQTQTTSRARPHHSPKPPPENPQKQHPTTAWNDPRPAPEKPRPTANVNPSKTIVPNKNRGYLRKKGAISLKQSLLDKVVSEDSRKGEPHASTHHS